MTTDQRKVIICGTALFVLVALISASAFAQNRKRVVLTNFTLTVDTYKESLAKLQPFNPQTSADTVLKLSEIYVEKYAYRNNTGSLELFFGNDTLYCVRYDIDDSPLELFYFDRKLYEKYKVFWDNN